MANSPIINRPQLEHLYVLYNSRKWVHPDPLEFLYDYGDFKDMGVRPTQLTDMFL